MGEILKEAMLIVLEIVEAAYLAYAVPNAVITISVIGGFTVDFNIGIIGKLAVEFVVFVT